MNVKGKRGKDNSKIRDEEKQTPIPTPLRSPGTNLSLDKEHTVKLMETNVHVSNVPSVSSHAKHLKGVVARMSRQNTYMVQNMKKTFLQRNNVNQLCFKIAATLDEEVPKKQGRSRDRDLRGD
ncbi:hypothetical protein Tco_0645596 [Tanacetum coccineum]